MAGGPGRMGSAFRALYVGSLVSNAGDGVRLAAIPLLAATLTSSPVLVSAVTAAQYLPWVTVAPLGGALVDRHDRRRIILVTQAWRGLVMLALGVLVLADVVSIWHLCVVSFVITAGEILVDPAVVALVPQVVADRELDAANGRIASAEVLTNDVAGRPVGAVVFGAAHWLPFLVDAVSYLASILPFRRVVVDAAMREDDSAAQAAPGTPSARSSTLRSDAAEGLRFLRRHPLLAPVTAATMVYYFGAATGFSLLVLLVVDHAGGPSWSFGVVLACGAAGALIGTLAGARAAQRFGTRSALATATVAEGVALAAMAASPSVAVLAAVWFIAGIPAGVRIPVARSLQQRLTPNEMLGRVNVSARMFTRGVIVAGALVSGALAAATGVRFAFVVGGALEVVAGALLARALRDAPSRQSRHR